MASIDVWKNQIILRLTQEEVPADWSLVGEHVKYSERMKAFHCAFSAQNLHRLRQLFGPALRVGQGQGRIESLKTDLHRFNAMVVKAELAKTSPVLPVYPYKAPPIGSYQNRGVVYVVNVPWSVLFADCGTGKTYMVACAIEQLIRLGILPRGKALICGKLATLYHGWLNDFNQFTNLKAVVLHTETKHKRREKLNKLLDEPADVYVINHEGVRVLEDELVAKGFHYIAVDESTVMKSYRSERSKGGSFMKALLRVAAQAKRGTIMTGTPASNGAQDLWGQLHLIDPHGFMLEASFHDFRTEHMDTIYYGDRSNPATPKSYVMKPESTERIGAMVNRLAYRVRIRDVLPDLPDRTFVKRLVRLGPEQKKHYREMEDTFHTEIDTEHVSVSIKLAQMQKLRQITGGFIIDHTEAAHATDDPTPKMEMLDQLLREEIDIEHKVVIFAQYKWEFEQLAERYKDLGVVTYYGDTKDKRGSLDAFMRGSAKIMIAHPQSCAHGLTWTCAHYMVFYSVSFSSEQDYQCVKRIDRNGQKFPMFIYYLLCEDTIDEAAYDLVQLKHHVQASLIDPDLQDRDAAQIWSSLKEQVKRHKKRKKG